MNEPCITTYSGKQVSLISPQPMQIDIGDIAHGLAYQCRFNGQVNRFYSVAQHCLMVASILPDHLKLVGLLHDAAEAYVGDVVQPLKMLLPDFDEIEQRFHSAIGVRLGINLEYNPDVKHADLVALATEKRDLLPRVRCDWALLEGITPLNRLTLPMSPERAEEAFLNTFFTLREARQMTPFRSKVATAATRLAA